MAAGGRREGAGRPAGSKGPYKLTKPRRSKATSTIQTKKVLEAVSMSPDKTPLAFLLATMQDCMFKKDGSPQPVTFRERFNAAVQAAPYVHAKLASIEVKGDAAAPLQVQSDIGQALKALAEMARNRNNSEIGENVIDLEPSSLSHDKTEE